MGRGVVDERRKITPAIHKGIGCIKTVVSPSPLHLCCAFCSLSTKIWFKLSVNKCAACQHKWQREWARGQSPPLTIKREKQSKEAININKVLTTIDYLALRWWAMIVMDLNSYTQLINIFTFLLKRPIRRNFLLENHCRSSKGSEAALCLLWHFSRMQWKLLLSSASCSLITHCKADRYFHQLHLSLGKSASFPLVHTQPVQKKYTMERPGALSWALSLWWDSGLLSCLKRPLSGRP